MPVRKFRNLQDMEDSLWREPGPELWRAITCPKRFPPGVYRHRSLEDAQRQREAWEEANFRALWESRGIKPEELKGRKV